MMNSRQAGEILAYLSAAWPRYELHEETIRVWVDQLQGIDFGAAKDAARRIVAEDDWFPAVSRMISLCRPRIVGVYMNGCSDCNLGFIENSSGEVAVCPNCRDTLSSPLEAVSFSPEQSYDWKKGIQSARRRLSNEDNR
jgi:hypothetical protein